MRKKTLTEARKKKSQKSGSIANDKVILINKQQ